MPLSLVHALGASAGHWAWWCQTQSCRITRTNLQLCFPDLPTQERDGLARQSLVETARTGCELGRIWSLPGDQALRHIVSVQGEEILDAALGRGKGVIVLAPHLGNWELTGLYLAKRANCTFLYKPPKLTAFNDTLIRYRGRLGAKQAPTTPKGVAMLLKALGKGELVGILPDQEPGPESGEFAPFFGIQALTMTLVSRLAQRSEAEVLSVFARRLPEARGFEIVIAQARPGIKNEDPRSAAAALNATVEDCVRQAPSQYQWEYRRFKHQPGQPKNALYR